MNLIERQEKFEYMLRKQYEGLKEINIKTGKQCSKYTSIKNDDSNVVLLGIYYRINDLRVQIYNIEVGESLYKVLEQNGEAYQKNDVSPYSTKNCYQFYIPKNKELDIIIKCIEYMYNRFK